MLRKQGTSGRLQQTNTRELYSRQPAHALIIDTSRPCDADAGQTVVSAIENFFSVVCSLAGPVRIACFSLLASSQRAEMILPMQKISRPLFSRLHLSLQKVVSLINVNSYAADEGEFDSVQAAIQLATSNFSKYKEGSAFTNQLEVTVLTCKSASRVRHFAGEIVQNTNLSDVKRIEFVTLSSGDDRFWSQNMSDDTNMSQEPSISGEAPDIASLWSVVQLDCKAVSIESHFRQWLKDESTDKEHLRMEIGGMVIKCDVQERLLNHDELPFRASFCIGSDLYMSTVPQGARGQNRYETLPIIQLRSKKVIPGEVICGSIVFGRPVVLVASACWQMDWDELETNQNHFLALCKRLFSQNECLLCENITRQQGRHRNYSLNNIDQPRGLFVAIPSKSSSLLLKSISPQELMLPTRIELIPEENDIPQTAIHSVNVALESLGKDYEFNPLEYRSELCQSLKSFLTPKPPSMSSGPVSKKPRLQTANGSRFPQ